MTETTQATVKTYPDHYIAADIESVTTISAWMTESKYTQAALARLVRISPTTLSQMLNGIYPTSPTKMLRSVAESIKRINDRGTQADVVETSVFKLAHASCIKARLNRNFSVFTAYVGTGKTVAIKNYQENNASTYLIEATPLMNVNTLVKLLAQQVLNYDIKGGQDVRFNAVIDALRNTDSVVLIDEAETLTATQLHVIRRLSDIAGIGITLCGTENLRGMINVKHGQFDQIRSRVGFLPPTIQTITRSDAAALVQMAYGAEEVADNIIERLYKYSGGSARMLVRVLIPAMRDFRVQNGGILNIKLIDAIAKQTLCLDPIKSMAVV